MNRSLEIHDSVVAAVTINGDDLIVSFAPAYIHESSGEPGVSAGVGCLQDALMHFTGVTTVLEEPATTGTVSDGYIDIDGARHYLIRVPYKASGKINALFTYTSGQTFAVAAAGLECSSTGESNEIDAYDG